MTPEETEEPEEFYDSGPFCRHWHDPVDCEVVCVTCGHRCPSHPVEDDLAFSPPCTEDGCSCNGWKDAEGTE